MEDDDSKPGNDKPEGLLGAPATNDWKLDPESHARRLKSGAAALGRVLKNSVIEEIMRRYLRDDELAAKQQAAYKQYGKWEIYLGAIAAILGGAVLLMSDASEILPLSDSLRSILLLIQVGCTAGVVALKYLLQAKQPFEKWQTARSGAETARIELFETVCGLTGRDWRDEVHAGDPPLLPLQLEYFIRYQLQVQLFYYDKRGERHRVAASRYVSVGAGVAFVAAFAAGLGGMTLEMFDTTSFVALVAMVAPILLAAQTSLSRLDQDERNAARYAITHAHLDRLAGRLDDVRKAARAGNATPVHAFIRDVNEIISVEHSQWQIQLQEKATAEAN